MKKKVRIKSLPKGYHMMPDGTIMKDSDHMAEGGSVRKNLSPIPREYANLEAERGEVALTDMGTGDLGMFAIGGERHSNGGTPLNLNPGSFIYSDTKKMKIKDPSFLAKYGKTKPVTPAKLVKPYLKMNDYKQVLEDQSADDIQKRTASRMIDTYKNKAGEIAFYQESMKGFPQGVPAVAQDYAQGIMGAAEMAYGGYIPRAQKGGTQRISVYTPEERAMYEASKQVEGTTYTPGMTAFAGDASRPAYQRTRPDKSYGEENITSPEALADLKARQPWIFEEKPNWSFSNPADVKWAQQSYEQRRKKFYEDQGLSYTPYFKEKSNPTYRPGEAFDARFGEHTFNMPALAITRKQPQVQQPASPEPVVNQKAVPAVPTINPADPNKTYAFQQDVNNEAANLMNMLSERRYFPFAPQLPFTPVDPTYMDDTRAQGMLAGQARSMAESLGAFAGPQQLASRISQISGASGEQAANIQAQLQQGNTGIANQFAGINAQLADVTNRTNLQTNVKAYDDTVKAMDTFDEKMRAYRTKATELRNATQSNKAKAELLNKLYPDFQINTMPGMYGNINVNPEALAAMQDPSKITDVNAAAEAARQQQIRDAFTLHPVKYDKDGKDLNAPYRSAYIISKMKSESPAAPSNPGLDYLKALQSLI